MSFGVDSAVLVMQFNLMYHLDVTDETEAVKAAMFFTWGVNVMSSLYEHLVSLKELKISLKLLEIVELQEKAEYYLEIVK